MKSAVSLLGVLVIVGLLIATAPAPRAPAIHSTPNVPSFVDLNFVSGLIAERVIFASDSDLQAHGEDNPRKGFPGPVTAFGPNVLVSVVNSDRAIPDNEPSIAISPKDRNNLVAGAHHTIGAAPSNQIALQTFNECGIYVSSDAGTTWTFARFAPLVNPPGLPEDFCSDPAVTADARGNFYYSYLSVRDDVSTTDIAVAKSMDGGKTWTGPHVAVRGVPEDQPGESFPDKEWIAADFRPTSKHKGNVYISYTDFRGDGCFIRLVRSTDGGTTWSQPRTVSEDLPFVCFIFLTTDGVVQARVFQGSHVAVAPSGRVYVAYFDSRGPPGEGPQHEGESWLTGVFDIMVTFSDDGGVTWSAPRRAFTGKEFDTICVNELGPGLLPGCLPPTRFRAWSAMFPSIAIATDGIVFIATAADPDDGPIEPATFGAGMVDPDDGIDDADIFVVFSKDGGLTWSPAIRANDDRTTNDQFFSWSAPGIAAKDNTVHVTWADRRDDPLDILYHMYYQAFASDGTKLGKNVRITDVASNPNVQNRGRFIGDYFNVAVGDVSVHPVWVDTRREATTSLGTQNRNQDIFTARGTAAKP